jgi:hypothetical protein
MEGVKKFLQSAVGATVTALTIIGGVIAIYAFLQGYSRLDLSGEWRVTNTIQSTSYHPFQGLQLGYRVFLTQRGTDITGTGEKWSENGKELPPAAHTQVQLTASISGNKVTGTFQEVGTERKTSGTFEWTYKQKPDTLTGTFTSTAADSAGSSLGTKPIP